MNGLRAALQHTHATLPETNEQTYSPADTSGCDACRSASGQTTPLNRWHGVRARLSSQLNPAHSLSVRRNALGVFSIRVLSAGLLFVSQIILARWIGAGNYGLYVALWSVVLVAGGLSHLGMSTAMMRLVPQYRAANALAELRGLLIGGRFIAIAGGLTVAAAGGLALWLAAKTSDHEFVVAAALALACLPAYALTEAQDGLGRGQGWTFESIAPPYILRPALLLLTAALAYSLALPASAVTAMACALAATWLTAIVQSGLIQRRITDTVPAGTAAFAFPFWLKVSLPLLAVSGSELVLQNADVLLLNALRPPEEVGIYYAAAKTTCLALFVHYAVGSAYSGRFATAGALGDHEGLQRLTREAVQWTFWPSLAVTSAVLAAGPFLLRLFGSEFAGAYPAMLILSVGLMARAATGPSEFVLNMLGRQNDCARSFATAAAVSIVLNLLLIPHWGAFGAATATACAFATASALNWRTARRELGLNLFVLARAQGARPPNVSGMAHLAKRSGDADASVTAPLAAAAIAYEVVRDEVQFDALRDDWNNLYATSAAKSQPFLDFAWNRHWLCHYHASVSHPLGVELTVVVGRRDGHAVIIWPLVTKSMAGMTYLHWMGQPVSQYGDVLVEASGATQKLLDESWAVIMARLAPDVVALRKVRADAVVAPLLKKQNAVATLCEQAPFIVTQGYASVADFEKRSPVKARKNRRRLLRRLKEIGAVEFVNHTGGPEAVALVQQAIGLKRAWLQSKGLISSALHDQRFEGFFKAASEATSGSAGIRVFALEVDGTAAAIMVAIESDRRLAGHIFAYDVAREKTGAGVLLLEDCLHYAVTNGYQAFDLLAPGDAYKYEWCDQYVDVCDWALASSVRGHIFTRLFLAQAREQIKQATKRLPPPVRKALRLMVLQAKSLHPFASPKTI